MATPSPLWPLPIPVLGLTGEKWSGKTLFALTIDPKRTLIYDTEKSSLSYQAKLGFTRIDVMAEMLARFPRGHKPIDRFVWWLEHVRSLEPGRYSVIACDTVNEIEGGLSDWVEAHPEHFGHSRAQYLKMSGIKWGDVKDHWLSILASDLASRCETFAFITHMGDVWGGDNRPTGKRKPKGKDTLFQLASLYLQMERKKDAKGNLPERPSAVVLKDRIADFATDAATGEIKVVPLLPARLPVATPHAVRQYMLQPADLAKPAAGESAPEPDITEDERAELRLRTAEAERDAAQLQIEKLDRQQRAAGWTVRQTTQPAAVESAPAPAACQVPPTPPTTAELVITVSSEPPVVDAGPACPAPAEPPAAPSPPPPATPAVPPARLALLHRLAERKRELFALIMPQATAAEQAEAWAEILARRGAKSALDLPDEALRDLAGKLEWKITNVATDRREKELAAAGVVPPPDAPF